MFKAIIQEKCSYWNYLLEERICISENTDSYWAIPKYQYIIVELLYLKEKKILWAPKQKQLMIY